MPTKKEKPKGKWVPPWAAKADKAKAAKGKKKK